MLLFFIMELLSVSAINASLINPISYIVLDVLLHFIYFILLVIQLLLLLMTNTQYIL